MTSKKRCGLRSVPSLFRVFANGVHAAPQEWRRHYKETALLFGRVAGRFTLSVNARSLRSLALGSVVSLSLASLRSPLAPLVLGIAPPALATLRPTALQAFDLRFAVPLAPLVRFSVSLRKQKRYFREKRAFRGTHIFPENGIFGFFSVSTPKKHESKQILYITTL